MSGLVGRAIGGVVNPVVSNVNFNDILLRIDLNEVIDRIDVDRVLERVDINLLLERINFDRLVERLPIEEIVDRSNIGEIVARSSSGIFSQLVDAIRAQAAKYDYIFQGMGRCRCYWRKRFVEWELPPKPGKYDRVADGKIRCPRNAGGLAYAMQGRNAGIVSRTCSYWIDELFIILSFAGGIALARQAYGVVQNEELNIPEWLYVLMYLSYGVSYDFLSYYLVGRTLGMAIMGLKLVGQRSGKWLGPVRCFIRALFVSIRLLALPSLIIGLIRKDRRHFLDLVCSSCVIYAWDARPPRTCDSNTKNSIRDIDPYFRPLEDDDDDHELECFHEP
jgi:uncharacterized RDD family membrane protein YckC